MSTMTGLEDYKVACGMDVLNSELESTELGQDCNYATAQPNKNTTYRSIGIESFFRKKNHNEIHQEFPLEEEEETDHEIKELQAKSEEFVKKMSFARKQRKLNEENEVELSRLKAENAQLKNTILKKDKAINVQRESAQESLQEIEKLKKRVADLELETHEVGDPNLLKNYKETMQKHDEIETELASK